MALDTTQKKDWAKMLYIRENMTQAEIAEKVGVSRKTINNWVNKERWDEHKAAIMLTKEEQIANLYRQVAAINECISNRPSGERFATPEEAKNISTLASAIDKLEAEYGIADIISVLKGFINHVRSKDLDTAKLITPLANAYIHTKIK